ncbi:MAG: response regulator transcription factor [Nitrospiraceae bacterium]
MGQSSAKKILVIEDDDDILQLVKRYLEQEGLRTRTAKTGLEGLKLAQSEQPDLIILDLMLPELDGLEVCKRLRAHRDTAATPIIMLTAKVEESDTVVGLELGADDYVTKPFSPRALTARVKALFRRLERSEESPPASYTYGQLVLDPSRHEVKTDGREIVLTAKEFGLLEHLLQNPGRVLTRDALLNAVWGYDYYGTTRTVDVHVRRLKQKISLLGSAIVSVKSLGYKLKEPEKS